VILTSLKSHKSTLGFLKQMIACKGDLIIDWEKENKNSIFNWFLKKRCIYLYHYKIVNVMFSM
jgi:hypothetical protein